MVFQWWASANLWNLALKFLWMIPGFILMSPNVEMQLFMKHQIHKTEIKTQVHIPQTAFHNGDKTIKQIQTSVTSNWIVTEGWCTDLGHWTDNGCSVLGPLSQFYSLLLSGNSAPTDVFTQPLLHIINELSVCVCVCGNNWMLNSKSYVQGLWLRGENKK